MPAHLLRQPVAPSCAPHHLAYIWKDAGLDMAVLKEAKAEFAKLQ